MAQLMAAADILIKRLPVRSHALSWTPRGVYYSPDSQNGKTEDPDYIGTPGYYAVNGLQPPSPEQVSKQASSQDPRPAALTRAPSRTYYYTIEPGDTIYSLARKHCVSMQDIRTVNKLNRKFEIRAGDVILLPKDRCKI